MQPPLLNAEKIVDTALTIAKKSSWENLRLFDIAHTLNVNLAEIQRYFREKNELVNVFFDRADRAMIMKGSEPEIMALPTQERLALLLITWFEYIQQHRQVAKEMMYAQLEPGHLHTHFSLLLRISRTVQWWRESAQRSASYLHRAIEETGLTAIYVASLFYWLRDDSKDAADTKCFIEKKLTRANKIVHFSKRFCSICSCRA
ncbi:hypothetical protein [Legionella jamestowniensis]|uniref:TetR family transporter regulatory protein n=1 Tax=Legionella jamestowniensis TaxID=455 RepID=A0A0W0UJN6_9GAMM|nr:hypothetical protein [Legionella jamestowniensis]KTD08113.1 TetR family transporter regulatory protein [Legionella jamestowniensis]OCH97501.1 hypothetical protein A8135_14335 [Legionella jamestowniensis]SFM09050.1 transcriptional regulator, TetR family [Legionella jamestowniensis DSM 19215]